MGKNIETYIELYSNFLSEHPSYKLYPELVEPIEYILSLPAKHLRPASMLLAYHEFAYNPENDIYKLSHAIEVFHNFTLMHDDIMDQADLRRGKVSTHKKYGENSSILSGDAMMLLSIKEILQTDINNKEEVLKFFMDIGIQICEGQAMDMVFEERTDVTVVEYIEMIRLKTSVLFGACLYLGSLVGGATRPQSEGLYGFGEKLGVAFQIQDDLLDVYGLMQKVGKRRAGDIYNRKKTILFLEAIKSAGNKDRETLESLYYSERALEEEDVDVVLRIFDTYNIKEKTVSLIQDLTDEAITYLEKLDISAESRSRFHDLADILKNREY